MSDASKTTLAMECYAKGNDSLKRGNFDYAIEMFFTCTRILPDKILFRQALRDAEFKKYGNNKTGAKMATLRMKPAQAKVTYAKARKNWSAVIEACEEALQQNPWEVSVLFELAKAAKELGMSETALWVAQSACAVDKKTKDLWVFTADLLEQAAMFDRAIAAWEMVKKIDPKDHDASAKARQLAASSTIQKGRYDDTEGFRKQMIETTRGSDVFAEDGGGDSPEARTRKEIAQLMTRLESDPTNAGIYVQLGDLYRKMADFDQAAAMYQKGLDATGGADFDIKARLMEARIDPLKRNLQVVKTRIEQLDRSQPDAEEKAKKLQAQGSAFTTEIIRREIEFYRFKVGLNSQDFASQFELGFRLLQLNQLDESIRALQQARGDSSRRWEALYWLGYAFWQKKNFVLADKNLSDALAELPNSADEGRKKVLYYRGRVAEDRKDYKAAIDFFNDVAAIDYGYKDVARRLDALNAQQAG